jgi:ABC-type phosphate/phosphonate transport system substrate-binding protein
VNWNTFSVHWDIEKISTVELGCGLKRDEDDQLIVDKEVLAGPGLISFEDCGLAVATALRLRQRLIDSQRIPVPMRESLRRVPPHRRALSRAGVQVMLLLRCCGSFVLASLLVASAVGADEPAGPPVARRDPNIVRIGAVAYAPSVVTAFQDLRSHLNRQGFPSDYVLYSNYDSLVAALARDEIDIAWNTPLAHAQYHVRHGGKSRTLVMRDVDVDVRSVLVVRAESSIRTLKDLAGKRLILGSADAAEATVLPIHYLKKERVDFDGMTLVSLDKEVDFRGNPCCSPSHVVQALNEGRGDAGIITESLWRQIAASAADKPQLRLIWTSPAFSHCVFTASRQFDEKRAQRFTELMTAMKPTDQGCREIMRLEGTAKWLPGRAEGFEDLISALRQEREPTPQ